MTEQELQKEKRSFLKEFRPSWVAIAILALQVLGSIGFIATQADGLDDTQLGELIGYLIGALIGEVILAWVLAAIVWFCSGKSARAARISFTIGLVLIIISNALSNAQVG